MEAAYAAIGSNIDASALFKVVIGTTDRLLPLRQPLASGVSALLAGGGPDGTHAFFVPRFANGAAISDGFASISNLYDSDLVGLPIKAELENASAGNLTDGNAGNSLTFKTVYMEIPV